MEQTQEFSLYQQYKNEMSENRKTRINYDFSYLLLTILGFIIGQAEVGAGFFPFSIIYWSIFIGYNKLMIFLVTLSTGLGLIFAGDWYSLVYIYSGIVGLVLYRFLKKNIE